MDHEFKLLREFAGDIMKFALVMSGYEYTGLFEVREEWVPDTFEYVFGQAVFYYRETHRERFEEILQSYHDLIFHDEATLLEYIKYGIQKVAKGDSLLMDFLRILAFYADLIVYCQRFDNRKAFVAVITDYFSEIYNYAGIKEVLQIAGSYGFLRRVAEEIIGPRHNEETFENRILRYRRQLEQGTPDQRRVSFALPEASERTIPSAASTSGAGRLASCLGMFACVSTNHTEENGVADQDDHPERKPGPSNIGFKAPSASRSSVRASSSTESEVDDSEGNSEKKENLFPEIKKPQSILKSPHSVKGQKRVASDEKASNNKKRAKCSDDGDDPTDTKTLTQEILIPIPDTLSDELRVSLDKILKEILDYNKANKKSDAYATCSESKESNPKSSEEQEITEMDDNKMVITDSDTSSLSSDSSKESLSKTEDPLKAEIDVEADVAAEIDEIKMETDGCDISSVENKTDTKESDDSSKAASSEPSCSSSKEEGRITSVRLDISFDSYVESENLEIPEKSRQIRTEKSETPVIDSERPDEGLKLGISSTESSVVEESKRELKEMNMTLDNCDKDSENRKSRDSESDETGKIVTFGDSVTKPEVSDYDQVEISECDSDNCKENAEASGSKLEESLKIINKADCSCTPHTPIDDKSENKIKMDSDGSNETASQDDKKVVTSGDSIDKLETPEDEVSCMDTGISDVSTTCSETGENKPNDFLNVRSHDSVCESDTHKNAEAKIGDKEIDSSDNTISKSSEIDANEPVESSVLACEADAPKDVETEICDKEVDSADNTVSKSSDIHINEPVESSVLAYEADASKDIEAEICDKEVDSADNTLSKSSDIHINEPVESSDLACEADSSKDVKAEIFEKEMNSAGDDIVSKSSDTDVADSVRESDASKGVQDKTDETKMAPTNCNIPAKSTEADVNESDDSPKVATSSDSECASTESDNVKMDTTSSDSAEHVENMECD